MANKFSGILGITVISALILPLGTSAVALEDTSNNDSHSITDHSATPPATEIGNEGLDSEDQVNLSPQQAESELVARAENKQKSFEETHHLMHDGQGNQFYASIEDKDSCVTPDRQPGQYSRTRMMLDDGNDYTGYYSPSGLGTFCTPVESRTLTANNPGEPRKLSPAEMLQEIEDKFANTDIRPPILKQSYNSGDGTGRAKGDPNIYKGDNVNFYAEAPTAYWESSLIRCR